MKKNYSISLIRFLAMILILCCHTFEWIGFELGESENLGIVGNYCAVGVQVFLLISGYLYGSRKNLFEKNNKIEFVLKNFKKILKDYYIYVLLVIFPAYYFLSPASLNIEVVLNVLTCSGTIEGVHHLWYIPYILVAYLITPILYEIKEYFLYRKHKSPFIVIIIIIAINMIIRHFYHIYFVDAWINCYVIGFFLPEIIERLSENQKKYCVSGILIASIILNYYFLTVKYELLPIYTEGTKNLFCIYYVNYSKVIFALSIFGFLLLITNKVRWKNGG